MARKANTTPQQPELSGKEIINNFLDRLVEHKWNKMHAADGEHFDMPDFDNTVKAAFQSEFDFDSLTLLRKWVFAYYFDEYGDRDEDEEVYRQYTLPDGKYIDLYIDLEDYIYQSEIEHAVFCILYHNKIYTARSNIKYHDDLCYLVLTGKPFKILISSSNRIQWVSKVNCLHLSAYTEDTFVRTVETVLSEPPLFDKDYSKEETIQDFTLKDYVMLIKLNDPSYHDGYVTLQPLLLKFKPFLDKHLMNACAVDTVTLLHSPTGINGLRYRFGHKLFKAIESFYTNPGLCSALVERLNNILIHHGKQVVVIHDPKSPVSNFPYITGSNRKSMYLSDAIVSSYNVSKDMFHVNILLEKLEVYGLLTDVSDTNRLIYA